jgi:serine/threonine protein kinase/Flp pilus assembly protein TadD
VVGQTLSHYLIESTLGEGGMGAVYLARDLALGRSAALKVVANTLDPELRERLLREAEAGARLQHPAIATFYESSAGDAGSFIAMEYVRGRTLRERLQSGPLAPATAVAIASALLEALNHAHAAGILHRDIKPENVMVTEGGAPKLLDFGLAKALSHSSRSDDVTVANLTGGRILGTAGYMSPEQLRAEELDPASDLFALGAVLYEMASGRAAFPGKRATERIAAILTRDPDPIDRPGLPRALWPIIRRALAKDRADRYGSASAMLSDLRASDEGVALASPLPQTIVVLDFRNLARQSDDDWIGSGVAESVSADLSRVPGLTLVGREKLLATLRSAGQTGADHTRDALALGSLLGCRWILLGSFQRLGPALRLTSQLTEVATGDIVAAEKLDGPVDTLFDMQDRLSRAVLQSLNLKLPTPAAGVIQARDLRAFECYARGRRLWQRLEKGTFDQARELFQKAISQEPDHAQALSGLAALHAMRFTFTTDPGELKQASSYARRAIAADPKLADPHVWLGYALMRHDRMDEALDEELRAAELDPENGYAPYFAGCVQQFRGRPAEAIPFFQRAVKREPPHGFAWLGLAWAHQSLGNLSECRWCVERAIALEGVPGATPTAGASGFLGECLRLSGQLAEARAAGLAGIEAAERSDHMYRDTFRAISLCSFARTALDQGDTAAAHAASTQVLAHIRGRERTLGGGFLVVQALAALARAGEGQESLAHAMRLFEERDRFNFSLLWTCNDETTLVDLARASAALGLPGVEMLVRARDAGSYEARVLLETGLRT